MEKKKISPLNAYVALEKQNIRMEKNETRFPPLTVHKNQLQHIKGLMEDLLP